MADWKFRGRVSGIMGSPARTDRILIGVCAGIWLVLLGISVAASVALVDLGHGHPGTARGPHTPWGLYTVIIISALIIVAAIPLLLRARNGGSTQPGNRSANAIPHRAGTQPVGPGHPAPRPSAVTAKAENLPSRSASDLPTAVVDRTWLRGSLALVGGIGGALVAVAAATYLMAVGRDGAAWVGYSLAAIVMAATPVIPWLSLRKLRSVLASPRLFD